MRQKSKVVGLAVAVCLVLGLVTAGNAFAGGTYKEGPTAWYASGKKLAVGETRNAQVATASPISIETTIGTPPVPIIVRAGGAECLKCTISNTSSAKAQVEGALKLTETRLEGLGSGCTVPSYLQSSSLKGVFGYQTGGSDPSLRLAPSEGGETLWVIHVEGPTCAFQGSFKMTGAIYGQSEKAFGKSAAVQSLEFSKGIQQALGGESFKFGANPAYVSGDLPLKLSPEAEFALKEK